MKILVINGSPKGEFSITLQTVRYLEKRFPEHSFAVLHAGQRIRALEKDFSQARVMLEEAEFWLFCYPVYTFLAPSQLHRFIELMKENGLSGEGKSASQITTSKHFYDVTAHRYIEDNCRDLGLRYFKGLSADMEDLLTPKGRREAEAFWRHLCWAVKRGFAEENRTPAPAPFTSAPVTPVPVAPAKPRAKKPGLTVIVADLRPEDESLRQMIARFQAVLPMESRVVDLQRYPFKGGCLGCFHCAADGQCVYKDGFDRFLREEIQTADAIVCAFSIRDHAMGARFKLYDDRQFCNGHRTVTMGMPIGYLVSGPYSRETNLQTLLEARAQVGGNPLCGIASDERDPNGGIDALAASLFYAVRCRYTEPQNFYGVGGMKIFRDLIYQMQGMMKADHQFYRSHGQYDFPQKRVGTILKMYLVGLLNSSPELRAKMGGKMKEGMIAPYRKVIEQAGKRR